MIRKESLRIGNLVLYKPYGNRDSEIKTIRGMLDMNAYFERHSNEYGMFHNLEGIPFSEDWLKKCGFVDGMISFSYHTKIRVEKYTTETQGWLNNAWRIILMDSIPHALGRQFQFVHEFQNLFFALCGQDLKIEL